MAEKLVHMAAESQGGEFTLCGDSFNIGDTERDEDIENPVFAGPGDMVTCPQCRQQIAACKQVKRWRLPDQGSEK